MYVYVCVCVYIYNSAIKQLDMSQLTEVDKPKYRCTE